MGKGDIKTKKGKISAGSYGKSRKRKASTTIVTKAPKVKKATPINEDAAVKKPATKKPVAKKPVAKKPAAKKPAAKKPAAKK